MNILRFLFLFIILPVFPKAQITTHPAVVTESGTVEITFNAAEGNQGLKGYTGKVYAHTGVITDKSTSGSDWKYAPAWGDNNAKYQLNSLGNDKWKLTISPDIRTYYNVPANEKMLKLAFVFRSEDNKKEGKGEGGTDLFVTLGEELFTPSEPMTKARPDGISDGINYMDNTTVILQLYAPGKKHIHLLGDFNEWKRSNDWQLYKDGDYWWYKLTNLEKGKEYAFQYLVDNSFKIADPYTEKILDPVYDPQIPATIYPGLKTYPVQTENIVSVLQTGKEAYDWQIKNFKAPEGEELVIYELLLRDFTTDGSLKAAGERLDYLKELGVNAIELMPIQEFDGNDSWGYNPCFFFAPDKAYGTPDDYRRFIDEAHRRGMAVILDVVFNHATVNQPFARLYWDSADNRPAADNPWFNIQAPHPYSVFNDFNHEYQGTRAFFKRVLTHWLTNFNVDGFRFDLSKGFTQKSSTESTVSAYDPGRIAILKDYHQQIQKVKPGAFTILEHFCDNREEKELADAGMFLWGNLNDAYCQSIMGWKENSDLSPGYAINRGWTKSRLIAFQESHDEERTLYKAKTWGNGSIKTDLNIQLDRAALNAAFLLCTPGPKMIWQFGELGYDYSIEENGRTGRKPVRWDYSDLPERAGLYDKYAKLLALRNLNPLVFSAPETVSMQTNASNWEQGRRICIEHPDMDIVLVGNFTSSPIQMKPLFPQAGVWNELFSNEQQTITDAEKGTFSVSLPAHSFRLYTNKSSATANEEIKKNSTASIQFDPHTNHLCIQSSDPVKQIRIYSALGSLVKKTDGTSETDLSAFPTGIYFIHIQTGQGIAVYKILKCL